MKTEDFIMEERVKMTFLEAFITGNSKRSRTT